MIAFLSQWLAWFDSRFCLLLSWALLHFIWQGCLLAIGFALVRRLMAQSSANLRYAAGLSVLTLMAACLPANLWLIDPARAPQRSVALGPAQVDESDLDDAAHGVRRRAESHSAISLPMIVPIEAAGGQNFWSLAAAPLTSFSVYAAAAYSLGLVVMLARVCVGLSIGQRLRRASISVGDPVLVGVVRTHAARLALRSVPALAWCSRVSVPVVVGVLRPMILLPISLATGLTGRQLELVLLHELAHIRRYDPLANLLQRLIEALLFFHPAMWWLTRQVNVERENACDDAVLRAGCQGPAYAEALLRVAELCASISGRELSPAGLLSATGENPSQLTRRVMRLFGATPPAHVRPATPAVALLTVLSAGAIIALAAWRSPATAQVPADPPPTAQSEPADAATAPDAAQSADELPQAPPDAHTDPSAESLAAAVIGHYESIESIDCEYTTQFMHTPEREERAAEHFRYLRSGAKWRRSQTREIDGAESETIRCCDEKFEYSFSISHRAEGDDWSTVQLHDRTAPGGFNPEHLIGRDLSNIDRSIPEVLRREGVSKSIVGVLGHTKAPCLSVGGIPTARTNTSQRYDVAISIDPNHDFLPRDILITEQFGSITWIAWAQHWHIPEYQKALDKKTERDRWFPTSGILKQGDTGAPDVKLVVDRVEINPPLPENLFTPDFPDGLLVVDATSDHRGQRAVKGGRVLEKAREKVEPTTEPADPTKVASAIPLNQQTVVEIRVVGNEVRATDQILNSVHARVGQPLDQAALERDVKTLAAKKWFLDVRLIAEQVAGGVRVTFAVVERPTLFYVKYLGNSKISDKRLARETELDSGSSFDPDAVEEGRRKIEAHYRSKGYDDVQAKILEGAKPGDRGVIYMINEGKSQGHPDLAVPGTVKKTKFIGNTITRDGRLKAAIGSQPPIMGRLPGPTRAEEIDEYINKLIAYYRDLGFFRARVSREVAGDAESKQPKLTFVIDEGPRYRVHGIRFVGNGRITDQQLSEGMQLKLGEFYCRRDLDKDLGRLRELYRAQGFMSAHVGMELEFDDAAAELTVTFNIKEADYFSNSVGIAR